MTVFRSPFQGQAVQFSPHIEGKLAVATAQYFGLVGNGRLSIVDLVGPPGPNQTLQEAVAFESRGK